MSIEEKSLLDAKPKHGRNPYISPTGEANMLDSFVCYADILGYKSMSRNALSNSRGQEFLTKLRAALAQAYESVRDEQWGGETNLFEVKVFTDNIVVGYPLITPQFDHGEIELRDILIIFSRFQALLAMSGFFIRGGVAKGLHYMDEDIVFGDALLEAVDLDKSGGPPRLLLAQSALEAVKAQAKQYPCGGVEPMNHYYILSDSDGGVFVNYLLEAFQFFLDGGVLFFDLLRKHQEEIEKGLESNKSKPDIRAKYEWILRYHNFVCRLFAGWHPVPINPDADEVYASSCVEAQKVLNFIIDINAFAVSPTEFTISA